MQTSKPVIDFYQARLLTPGVAACCFALAVAVLLLLAAAAHAAPVMVVDSDTVEYLDGWQLDANGWLDTSVLTVDEVFYVSSSIGNDSYDGTSGTVDGGGVGPKATLAAGCALLGAGDWLLLKRGDDWIAWDEEELYNCGAGCVAASQSVSVGTKSGLSKAAPILVGAYGSGARPKVYAVAVSGSSYVVIRDIHAVKRFNTINSTYVFFENIYVHGEDFLLTETPQCDLGDKTVVSRCIFDDSYTTVARTGIYTNADGLTLVSSFFWGNRDRESKPEEVGLGNAHALYAQIDATELHVDNCVVWEVLTPGGLQMRPGGTMTNCLGYRAYAVGSISSDYNWPAANGDGVSGYAAYNVGIETAMYHNNSSETNYTAEHNLIIDSNFSVGGHSRGGTFANNTIIRGMLSVWPAADFDENTYTFLDNTVVRANEPATQSALRYVDDFASSTWINTHVSNGENVDISNVVQLNGSKYPFSQFVSATQNTGSTYGPISFVDPTRGMKSYLEDVLGLGPYSDEQAAWDAYRVLVFAMDRASWNGLLEAVAVNAHIRAGFEVSE